MSKAKVYSVCINKGGVGKTTVATSIAAVISMENPTAKVLLIDTDGQGNCSLAYGLNAANFDPTMYDVITGDANIEETLVKLDENLFLAPANADMNFVELDILTNLKKYPNHISILNEKIKAAREKYDYIVIDTPPAMSLTAANVFAIEDNNVLIPFNPESFAVSGLINVIKAVEDFRKSNNESLRIAGIIGSSVKSGTKVHTNLLDEARKYCDSNGIPFLETVVPQTVRFVNATEHEKKPAVYVDKSPQVRSYFEIWKELNVDGTKK